MRLVVFRDKCAVVIGEGGDEKGFLTVFLLFRVESARKAGGPFVFVVEPCEHIVLLAFFHAGANKIHVLLGEIRRRHADARVHHESAEAHFLQIVDFLFEKLWVQFTVPCPKGRRTVFRRRISE